MVLSCALCRSGQQLRLDCGVGLRMGVRFEDIPESEPGTVPAGRTEEEEIGCQGVGAAGLACEAIAVCAERSRATSVESSPSYRST